jgi:hypothetical protein
VQTATDKDRAIKRWIRPRGGAYGGGGCILSEGRKPTTSSARPKDGVDAQIENNEKGMDRHDSSDCYVDDDDDNNHDDYEVTTEPMYNNDNDVIPDPQAATVDLSKLRGSAEPHGIDFHHRSGQQDAKMMMTEDLENLAELVPDVRTKSPLSAIRQQRGGQQHAALSEPNYISPMMRTGHDSMELQHESYHDLSGRSGGGGGRLYHHPRAHTANHRMHHNDHSGHDSPSEVDAYSDSALDANHHNNRGGGNTMNMMNNHNSSSNNINANHKQQQQQSSFMSAQSISTATQTHEVLMPMYLPTFKPATGCTNASDFIVRCFVARLRSGITVVKHGRSRWCKSRLRILHVHPDGRSLSWKPAEGEPSSSKRPPKLDLSSCTEVRHAWSPDPQNPMYTGTSVLRLKCEAANAHKSFALIFPTRTVDITAVTADQCKVLMEGFSALCFRLQVANLAKSKHSRPMPEEDGASTTASATLTNNSSTPRGTAANAAAVAAANAAHRNPS